MDTDFAHREMLPDEPSARRAARAQADAKIVAAGFAEIDAGLSIELDELEAWFRQLDVDENAPPPVPKVLLRQG